MKKNKYRFLIPLLGLIVVVAVILPEKNTKLKD